MNAIYTPCQLESYTIRSYSPKNGFFWTTQLRCKLTGESIFGEMVSRNECPKKMQKADFEAVKKHIMAILKSCDAADLEYLGNIVHDQFSDWCDFHGFDFVECWAMTDSIIAEAEKALKPAMKNYQSYKGRSIDFSQNVEIYKNLHNGLWSVRQGGLVVAHLESFKLDRVSFRVSESGRQRVIKEGRKNVHAFICGLLDPEMVNFLGTEKKKAFHAELVQASKLYYNPYKTDHFMIKQAKLGDYSLHCSKKCVHSTLFLIGGPSGIAAIL